MLCIRCGNSNDPLSKLCKGCGAVLPRNMGELSSSSSHTFEEGRSYDPPEVSYPNNAIEALAESLDAFFAGEGSGKLVMADVKELENRLGGLLAGMSDTTEAIEAQKEADPDDLPHRMGYLLQAGVQKFNDAMDRLRELMGGAEDDPDEILHELQTGNDYICHSAHLVNELFARDGKTVTLVFEDEPSEAPEAV